MWYPFRVETPHYARLPFRARNPDELHAAQVIDRHFALYGGYYTIIYMDATSCGSACRFFFGLLFFLTRLTFRLAHSP